MNDQPLGTKARKRGLRGARFLLALSFAVLWLYVNLHIDVAPAGAFVGFVCGIIFGVCASKLYRSGRDDF